MKIISNSVIKCCGLPLPSNQKKRIFEILQISPKPCRIYGLPGAARNQFIRSGKPSTAEESKGYIAGSTSTACFPPGTNFKPTFWSTLMNRKTSIVSPNSRPKTKLQIGCGMATSRFKTKKPPSRVMIFGSQVNSMRLNGSLQECFQRTHILREQSWRSR